MIEQLTVYDESGAPIGMTFPKRARQLISKQRALWHDDTHTAIRLLPETKADTAAVEYQDLDDDDLEDTTGFTGSDDLLLYLAKKNVREKRNLLKHIVAFIAAWPMIIIFYDVVLSNVRHRSHWRLDSIMWQLGGIRQYLPDESEWVINDIEWSVRSIVYNITHPLVFGIIGFMVAWGAWILLRCVKRVIMLRTTRDGRVKPDPVQKEYQRLKSASAVKY